jgi:hypothetical protein
MNTRVEEEPTATVAEVEVVDDVNPDDGEDTPWRYMTTTDRPLTVDPDVVTVERVVVQPRSCDKVQITTALRRYRSRLQLVWRLTTCERVE